MPSRAGSRTRRFHPGYGKQSSNRLAWLRTFVTHQLAVVSIDPTGVLDEEDPEFDVKIEKSEKGPNYLLLTTIPGRRKPLVWNMCAMTSEELEATRQFFNYLFDLADPIVRERDKVAEDAFSEGDDSYHRSYRQLPQFVVRARQEPSDSEGVHNRPPNASVGDGD